MVVIKETGDKRIASSLPASRAHFSAKKEKTLFKNILIYFNKYIVTLCTFNLAINNILEEGVSISSQPQRLSEGTTPLNVS